MSRIIPHKLVISYDKDGEVSSSILQYKIENNGVVKNEFFTMSVDAGINKSSLTNLGSAAKMHAERGEGLRE